MSYAQYVLTHLISLGAIAHLRRLSLNLLRSFLSAVNGL
jgi:hypothetical protein